MVPFRALLVYKSQDREMVVKVAPYTMPQGEIVNILLKIKNSFLPTKQILIGL